MRSHTGRYELRRRGQAPERGARVELHGREEALAMLLRAARRPDDVRRVRRHLANMDVALHHLGDDDVLREAARHLTLGRSWLFFIPDPALSPRRELEEEEPAPAPYEAEAGFGFIADIGVLPPPLFEPKFAAAAPLLVEPEIVFQPPPRQDALEARSRDVDEEARDPRSAEPGKSEAPAETFIEVQMIGEDGAPLAGIRYRLALTDGTVAEGQLDAQGVVRVGGLDPGKCTISFPDLDQDAWEPA